MSQYNRDYTIIHSVIITKLYTSILKTTQENSLHAHSAQWYRQRDNVKGSYNEVLILCIMIYACELLIGICTIQL